MENNYYDDFDDFDGVLIGGESQDAQDEDGKSRYFPQKEGFISKIGESLSQESESENLDDVIGVLINETGDYEEQEQEP